MLHNATHTLTAHREGRLWTVHVDGISSHRRFVQGHLAPEKHAVPNPAGDSEEGPRSRLQHGRDEHEHYGERASEKDGGYLGLGLDECETIALRERPYKLGEVSRVGSRGRVPPPREWMGGGGGSMQRRCRAHGGGGGRGAARAGGGGAAQLGEAAIVRRTLRRIRPVDSSDRPPDPPQSGRGSEKKPVESTAGSAADALIIAPLRRDSQRKACQSMCCRPMAVAARPRSYRVRGALGTPSGRAMGSSVASSTQEQCHADGRLGELCGGS